MTAEEFSQLLKKQFWLGNILNYILAALIIITALVLGGFITYKALNTGLAESILAIACSLLMLLPGFYMLWRIPKEYEIVTVPGNKTIAEKTEVVKQYLRKVDANGIVIKQGLITAGYQPQWWLRSVEVNVFVDEEKFLLSAFIPGHKPLKGIIDFGQGYTARKNLAAFITKHCNVQ